MEEVAQVAVVAAAATEAQRPAPHKEVAAVPLVRQGRWVAAAGLALGAPEVAAWAVAGTVVEEVVGVAGGGMGGTLGR